MRNLNLALVLMLALSACGSEDLVPQSDAPTVEVAVASTPAPVDPAQTDPSVPPASEQTITPVVVSTPLPSPSPGIPTFSLTYHTVTKTVAPDKNWITKTYVASGSCVAYQARTYCWDDGVKILQWESNHFVYGPFYFSYWDVEFDSRAQAIGACKGGCANDAMAQPRIMGGQVETVITQTMINTVLSGTAVTVTCFEDQGKLQCGDFMVDLNQTVI